MAAKKTAPKSSKAKKPVAKVAAGKATVTKPSSAKPAAAKPAAQGKPVAAKAGGAAAKPSPAKPVTVTPAAAPVVASAQIKSPRVPPPRPAPTPTGESMEPSESNDSSLLAGPRNVLPYVPKRGEQYMNKEQLDHFRRILGQWKHDLMVEVDRTVSHMKDEAANFPDPNDRATQEEEFSLELRTRDRERKLIRKIDEALKRIEDGSYGYCLETGEHIGIKRLEARPVATLSIEAQERRERRERQYGDRDDRYR
jgi:DnaK suppressor protein